MADLTDLQSAQTVKIAGSASSGIEDNYVDADGNGNLKVIDYATGATGASVPVDASYIAGKNSGNLVGMAVDSSGNVQTVGNVASGASDSGNPVKIGGVYNTTLPTLTNGQRGDVQVDDNSRLIVTSIDESPATQNITVQDTGSSTTTGANQQTIITGTATVGSVATFSLSSDQAMIVQVSGTWTGTLQTEISMDSGTTWFIRPIHQTGTLFTFSSFTANFTGGGNCSGYTTFRVRAIAAMTGTATIKVVESDNVSTVYVGNIVQNAPIDGTKATYAASVTDLTVAATPTDVFTITGSATKTVRVLVIGISSTQNTASMRDVLLIKRSTANSGGTSAASTAVPNDSNNAAATATVLSYTANPSLGSTVGVMRTSKLGVPAANLNAAGDRIIWTFGDHPGQAIVLRGTSQVLAINLNSVSSAGSSFEIFIEWSEE